MISSKFNFKNSLDFILTYLLISISGNPFFKGELAIVLVFILAFTTFVYRKIHVQKNIVLFFTLFTFVVIIQSFKFNFFPLITITGIYIRILTAYLIVRILGFKFIYTYTKTIYIIAITSLIFYCISNISGEILSRFSVNTTESASIYPRYSIYGLFTFVDGFTYRNSGPFWEPGAFSGYLVLALFFNTLAGLNKINFKSNLVLIVAIISTLSTTGYLATLFFFTILFQSKINMISVRIFLISLSIVFSTFLITNYDFLGEKIINQWSSLNQNVDASTEGSDRFISMLKDFDEFKGHELSGRGFHSETRYKYVQNDQVRTFGISDILVKLGLPLTITTFYLLFISLKRLLYFYNNKNSFFLIASYFLFFIPLMSQVYLNYSLYWSYFFLCFVYPPSKTMKYISTK